MSGKSSRIKAKPKDQYRLLFESNPHPMWVYDLETLEFLTVNKAAIHRYGYSGDEFLGMTIKDIRPPEDIPGLLENVSKVTEGLDDAGIWRHKKKDGSIIYVEIVSHTIDFNGRRAEMVLANDITKRKQAEDALKLSEEKYRDLFENANDAICIVDSDLKFRDVNKKTMEMTGYSKEELLKMSILDIIPPEQIPKSQEEFNKLHNKGYYEKFVGKIRSKEGYYRDVEVNSSAIINDGRVLGSRDIIRDITERKLAEEELKLKAQLLDRATDSIFVHDRDGNFLYMNEVAYKSRGYAKDELMGMNLHDIVVQEFSGHMEQKIDTLWEKGEAVYESAHFKKNGSIIPVEVHSCIFDSGGRKLIMAVTRDIAERKEAEKLRQERTIAELYGFIVSALPVFASNVPSQVRHNLIRNFAQRFDKNIRPRFEEEIKYLPCGLNVKKSIKEGIPEKLDIFMLWLGRMFENINIRTNTSYEKTDPEGIKADLEFMNCPWKGEAKVNPIFCFICRTIVLRSFTWTKQNGSAHQKSSIANGSKTCRFEIQVK